MFAPMKRKDGGVVSMLVYFDEEDLELVEEGEVNQVMNEVVMRCDDDDYFLVEAAETED